MDNYRFEVSYLKEDDEYLVRYADFENVIGVGKTVNDAIEEARNNLELYIEACKELNIDIPKASVSPSSYSKSSTKFSYSMSNKK